MHVNLTLPLATLKAERILFIFSLLALHTPLRIIGNARLSWQSSVQEPLTKCVPIVNLIVI